MKQQELEEKLKIRDILQILWKALLISVRTKNKMSMLIQALGFVMAFMPVWISFELKRFTDEIQLISQGKETMLPAVQFLLILVLLYVLQAGYTFAADYYAEVDRQRIVKFIKKTIMDCASRVQYKYIENEKSFREKLEFAENFGGRQVAGSMQQTIVILQQSITFFSVVLALVQVNVWIVVALLAASIPAVVFAIKYQDEKYKSFTKSMREGAMATHLFYMASGANESCKSMNDVRFYGLYPWIKDKWRNLSAEYLRKKNDVSRKHVLFNSMADILRNSVYIVILLLAAREIYRNPAVGLGVFMLVFTLSTQLQATTAKLFVGAAQFLGDLKYMRDFFQLQETPKEKYESEPLALERADIVFDRVSFRYPHSSGEALKDVTVTIRQGEKIAVVGENGSGKSTFIHLLCGLYEPTSGTITVNGLRVQDHLLTVRNAISVVFQNFGKYETTIRENITISDRSRHATDEELMSLAAKANALDFIETQPHGLDEVVGTFSASGNNLSGGQWQRVAIARAIYRDKAKIMVLDEPTAALDPIAEARLYQDFTALTGDKTVILISHRLGITSIVDRILVFADGRIVEEGNHEQLMAKGGHYAKMYRAQAQWYQDKLEVEAV